MSNAIIEILSVVDTREYELVGDKCVAIPDSGIDHECSRCGKLHQVHAHVRLEDNTTAVVGTGCMKNASMELVRELNRAVTTAKKTAKLNAQLKRLTVLKDDYAVIIKAVASLPLPEIRYESDPVDGWNRTFIVMGDTRRIYDSNHAVADELSVRHAWTEARATELGATYDHKNAVKELQNILKKNKT